MVYKWRGIPCYFKNINEYKRLNNNINFQFKWKNVYPALSDRYTQAGTARGHYFWQDLWAARYIYDNNVKTHIDVGSRLDGMLFFLTPRE